MGVPLARPIDRFLEGNAGFRGRLVVPQDDILDQRIVVIDGMGDGLTLSDHGDLDPRRFRCASMNARASQGVARCPKVTPLWNSLRVVAGS